MASETGNENLKVKLITRGFAYIISILGVSHVNTMRTPEQWQIFVLMQGL